VAVPGSLPLFLVHGSGPSVTFLGDHFVERMKTRTFDVVTAMPQEIETVLARVFCDAPSLVEVHLKPDARITVEAMGEIMQVRRSLLQGGTGAILFVAPGELEWETAVLRTDHFNDDRENLTAVAVMVDSRVLNTVVNTYFTLFPPEFPMKVFDSVAAAKEWLREPAV